MDFSQVGSIFAVLGIAWFSIGKDGVPTGSSIAPIFMFGLVMVVLSAILAFLLSKPIGRVLIFDARGILVSLPLFLGYPALILATAGFYKRVFTKD